MSIDTRARVIGYWKSGLTVRKIKERLLEQDIVVSVQSLSALIKKYKITSSVADLQTYKPLELFKEIHYNLSMIPSQKKVT